MAVDKDLLKEMLIKGTTYQELRDKFNPPNKQILKAHVAQAMAEEGKVFDVPGLFTRSGGGGRGASKYVNYNPDTKAPKLIISAQKMREVGYEGKASVRFKPVKHEQGILLEEVD